MCTDIIICLLQLCKENVWEEHLEENTHMIVKNVFNEDLSIVLMSFPYVRIFYDSILLLHLEN